jgi:subtilisin family serine protease
MWIAVRAILAMTLLVPTGGPAGGSAPAEPKVSAIVVLDNQVDPGTVRAPSRRERQGAVVRALRARAAADQKGVLSLLGKRRRQGLVTEVVPLWVRNAVAVVAAPSVIRELASRPEVRTIEPDRSFQAPPARQSGTAEEPGVEPNVALVNAPALWSFGIRGQGTVVATMDTGVDAGHPDLASRWRGGSNSWYDPNGEHPTVPTDVNGHGTSTMGVMVGGTAGGTAIGVAPEATWIAVKIFNDRGTASSTKIHLGYQWLLDPDGDPATADAPDVVNNSWTGAAAGCYLDFQADLRNLRAGGIVPVFSAGNYGPTPSTVLSPANLPEALSVGATDNADGIDPSSSRGPSACGQAVAPRVVAPGVGVRTTDLYGLYTNASGTSLAAPHVAGVLALLLSALPDLSAERQQAAVEAAAVDLGAAGPDNTYGYGRLDAFGAYQWLTSAPDYTLGVSPPETTIAAGGAATYQVSVAPVNGFSGDITLSVSGLPATQASWSFSPPVVTGGSGSAQLSVATAATIAPGSYPLTISAVSGALTRTVAAQLVVTGPPDFALGVAPAARDVVAGSIGIYAISVTATNGFAGVVDLRVAGLPSAVGDASVTPASVDTAGTATLTITTLGSAPAGTYPLTVTGTSGSTSHSVAITLVVTPKPDFALSASPSSNTVLRRQSASWTVSGTAVGGFAGVVALSIAGLPAGSSASFTPSAITGSGASTLRVSTTGQTARGTFTLRITGTSGSLVHQATVTLVVR